MEYTQTETKKSSGVAKAGLTLGIIGTALSVLNNNGNGILGLGGNRSEDLEANIANLESTVARLESMRYTDGVGIDLYKNIIAQSNLEDAKINAVQKELYQYVIDLDKRTALNEQAMTLNRQYDTMARDYQFALMDAKMNCCCEKQTMITNFNQQLNELANASIISYVNSNFLPGTLYLPAGSITPPVVTK